MRPAGHAIRLCEKWQVTTAFPTRKNGEIAAAVIRQKRDNGGINVQTD
jgi:hypothetical protein